MNNLSAANIQALEQYKKIDVHTGIENASPHRLIQMLLNGALSRIARAKGYVKNNELAQKGESISMAISIIGGLRDSLDHSVDDNLANNLDSLYAYMTYRLTEANLHNDVAMLDEVHALLMEIKTAWDAIADTPDVIAMKNSSQVEPAA